MLADTPLVKNLDNAEYMKILLNGSSTLEECFAKIDTNIVIGRLKAERNKKEKISPQMKKIIRLPDLPEGMIGLVT